MKVERYRMIYIKKIDIKFEDEIMFLEPKLQEEIQSDNIRILGKNFVKNNSRKAKLIINNKRYQLKEFINCNKFINDTIKINMI